jgi:polar amino acid transport system permease protein
MHYHWDLSMVLADSSRWWSAAGVTMLYSFATVVGGIVIGVICGLGLLSRRRWLTLPLEGYVEVFRCTPLLVQIVWFYLRAANTAEFQPASMAGRGARADALHGGVLFRACVMSIGRGQWQAGRALG